MINRLRFRCSSKEENRSILKTKIIRKIRRSILFPVITANFFFFMSYQFPSEFHSLIYRYYGQIPPKIKRKQYIIYNYFKFFFTWQNLHISTKWHENRMKNPCSVTGIFHSKILIISDIYPYQIIPKNDNCLIFISSSRDEYFIWLNLVSRLT